MKTMLITVSVAAIALWGGFAIGYHSGVQDTEAVWHSRLRIGADGKVGLSFDEVTTSSRKSINTYPVIPDIVITNR